MKWLIILILVLILWIPLHFLLNVYFQRQWLSSKGGIKTYYKSLIEGLLEYSSAEILQDKKSFLKIGGTYKDMLGGRECGTWSFLIMPNPPYKLNIKFYAAIDLSGGETANKTWTFPNAMNQNQILSIIKKKADEFDAYGIYK